MPNSKREAIEKRQLEAEKVVISKMLYWWKKKYGMDYIILVRNGSNDVFGRCSKADDEALEELLVKLEDVLAPWHYRGASFSLDGGEHFDDVEAARNYPKRLVIDRENLIVED